MQLTHIRKSDLNLLPALAALLEERSISKAAARHHLSQPAMSRVLQRLRGTFRDELLVRTSQGYALTARCGGRASTPRLRRIAFACAAPTTCPACSRRPWPRE
jgi:DNA-binding transcriptional LysR family regulator